MLSEVHESKQAGKSANVNAPLKVAKAKKAKVVQSSGKIGSKEGTRSRSKSSSDQVINPCFQNVWRKEIVKRGQDVDTNAKRKINFNGVKNQNANSTLNRAKEINEVSLQMSDGVEVMVDYEDLQEFDDNEQMNDMTQGGSGNVIAHGEIDEEASDDDESVHKKDGQHLVVKDSGTHAKDSTGDVDILHSDLSNNPMYEERRRQEMEAEVEAQPSTSQKTTDKPRNTPQGKKPNNIKSPSDTTIYVLALNKNNDVVTVGRSPLNNGPF